MLSFALVLFCLFVVVLFFLFLFFVVFFFGGGGGGGCFVSFYSNHFQVILNAKMHYKSFNMV